MSKLNQPESNRSANPTQFGLVSILLLTAAVGVFFAIWAAGWYLAAWGYGMISGFVMMGRGVVTGRTSPIWAIGLMLFAAIYTLLNCGIYLVTYDYDSPYTMRYVLGVIALLPLLVVVATVWVTVSTKQLDWLGVMGFTVWLIGVAGAHYLMVLLGQI